MEQLMLSLKNSFYILFLLLFSFGSFGAIFERSTQSKTHPNIYFQYQATGNVRTSVDVYEITPKGWTVKNVLVFGN